MRAPNPYFLLLLTGYFLLFSTLPQDYGFLGKIMDSIETIVTDNSPDTDPGHTDPSPGSEEEEESIPPPLVEEEDSYLHEQLTYIYILSNRVFPYRVSNEYCNGIIPSIPIPPPDRALA